MLDRRVFCVLIAGSAAIGGPVRAQATWKMATGYRAESFQGRNIVTFIEEVAAIGGGPRIELHANNSLFKLGEVAAAVRAGKIELGETIMTSLVAEMPLAGADSVPFVVRNYADAARLWRHQKPVIEGKFTSAGLKPLFAVPWPPQGLYANKPVTQASDLRGLRMRTYNRTTERIAELLGAKPVDIPMAQVGQAFADGRVDCMITSAVTGVENEVWSHVRHYYEIDAWFPKNIVFANLAAFNALPPAVRQDLVKAAAAAEARGWAASERAAGESVAELRRRGMRIDPVSHDLLREIKRLGERFSLEWVREVGAEANDIFIPYYTQV